MMAAAHSISKQEGETAEHLAFGHLLLSSELVTQSLGKFVVVGHVTSAHECSSRLPGASSAPASGRGVTDPFDSDDTPLPCVEEPGEQIAFTDRI
jgi:hypothetical protein